MEQLLLHVLERQVFNHGDLWQEEMVEVLYEY